MLYFIRIAPLGGGTNQFNLESINPINNNINRVNLHPWLLVLILGTTQLIKYFFLDNSSYYIVNVDLIYTSIFL